MSIQQSVNNMLTTAAVIGGVAKHGIEEQKKTDIELSKLGKEYVDAISNINTEQLGLEETKISEKEKIKNEKELVKGLKTEEANRTKAVEALYPSPYQSEEEYMNWAAFRGDAYDEAVKDRDTIRNELTTRNKDLEARKLGLKATKDRIKALEVQRAQYKSDLEKLRKRDKRNVLAPLLSEGGKK